MSKIYQPVKNNPYRVLDKTYLYTVWDIRAVARVFTDYYEGLEEYKPTQKTIDNVLQAKEVLQEKYREAVFNNIAFEEPIPKELKGKQATLEKAKYIKQVAGLQGYELGPRVIVHKEYRWD